MGDEMRVGEGRNVTAVIPAYNEEKYIGNVLDTLRDVQVVSQIIVVNDGSVDKTVDRVLEKSMAVPLPLAPKSGWPTFPYGMEIK